MAQIINNERDEIDITQLEGLDRFISRNFCGHEPFHDFIPDSAAKRIRHLNEKIEKIKKIVYSQNGGDYISDVDDDRTYSYWDDKLIKNTSDYKYIDNIDNPYYKDFDFTRILKSINMVTEKDLQAFVNYEHDLNRDENFTSELDPQAAEETKTTNVKYNTRTYQDSLATLIHTSQEIVELCDYIRVLVISFTINIPNMKGGTVNLDDPDDVNDLVDNKGVLKESLNKGVLKESSNKGVLKESSDKHVFVENFTQEEQVKFSTQYDRLFEILNFLKDKENGWLSPSNIHDPERENVEEDIDNIVSVLEEYYNLFEYYLREINNQNSVYSINNSNFIRNGLFLYFFNNITQNIKYTSDDEYYRKVFEIGKTNLTDEQINYLYNNKRTPQTTQIGGNTATTFRKHLKTLSENAIEIEQKMLERKGNTVYEFFENLEIAEPTFYTSEMRQLILTIASNLDKEQITDGWEKKQTDSLIETILSVVKQTIVSTMDTMMEEHTNEDIQEWNNFKELIISVITSKLKSEFTGKLVGLFGTKRMSKIIGVIKKLTPIFSYLTDTCYGNKFKKDTKFTEGFYRKKTSKKSASSKSIKNFSNNLVALICRYIQEKVGDTNEENTLFEMEKNLLDRISNGETPKIDELLLKSFSEYYSNYSKKETLKPGTDQFDLLKSIIGEGDFIIINNAMTCKINSQEGREQIVSLLSKEPNYSIICPPASKLDAMGTFGTCHSKSADNTNNIDVTFFNSETGFEFNYVLTKNKKDIYITEYYIKINKDHNIIYGAIVEQNISKNNKKMLLSASNSFERLIDVVERNSNMHEFGSIITQDFNDIDFNLISDYDTETIISCLSNKAIGDLGQEITALMMSSFDDKPDRMLTGSDRPSFVRASVIKIELNKLGEISINPNTTILYASEKGKKVDNTGNKVGKVDVYYTHNESMAIGGNSNITKRKKRKNTKRKNTKRKNTKRKNIANQKTHNNKRFINLKKRRINTK